MLVDVRKLRKCKSDDFGSGCYSHGLSRSDLFPVGELVDSGKDPVVICVPSAKTKRIDKAWFGENGPALEDIVAGVRVAFIEYCSESWPGADMYEEVVGELSGELSSRFKKDGYLPFFEVSKIVVDQDKNAWFVEGACSIERNLDEHGVLIKHEQGVWNFGYPGDEVVGENAEFIARAFSDSVGNVAKYYGVWVNMKAVDERLEFGDNGVRNMYDDHCVNEFRYEVRRCSSSHIWLDLFRGGKPFSDAIYSLDGDELCFHDFDGEIGVRFSREE